MLEVLPDSQGPSQAYKFDIVCFCKPSHPTRAECTLCEDRTRFDRSRYQTRPPCLPNTPPTVHNIPATLLALAITLRARVGHISRFWSTLGTGTHTPHMPRMHTAAIVSIRCPTIFHASPRQAHGVRRPHSSPAKVHMPVSKNIRHPQRGPLSRRRPSPAVASAIAMPAFPAGKTCRAGASNTPQNRHIDPLKAAASWRSIHRTRRPCLSIPAIVANRWVEAVGQARMGIGDNRGGHGLDYCAWGSGLVV